MLRHSAARAAEPTLNDVSSRSMLAKAADILGAFSVEHPVLTQAQITRRANLAHSTARRLVAEMVDHGILERTDDGSFTLGLRLWELGALSHRVLSLRDTAMPFMTVLNQALGQHVQLAVREGNEAVIVERLSATNAVGLQLKLRTRVPLHASATGKILLAYASEAEIDDVLSRPLTAFTPHTVTDPQTQREDLAEVARQGYAVMRDETQLGVAAVAAPIRTARRQLVASLSVVVPSTFTEFDKLIHGVTAAAKAISAAM